MSRVEQIKENYETLKEQGENYYRQPVDRLIYLKELIGVNFLIPQLGIKVNNHMMAAYLTHNLSNIVLVTDKINDPILKCAFKVIIIPNENNYIVSFRTPDWLKESGDLEYYITSRFTMTGSIFKRNVNKYSLFCDEIFFKNGKAVGSRAIETDLLYRKPKALIKYAEHLGVYDNINKKLNDKGEIIIDHKYRDQDGIERYEFEPFKRLNDEGIYWNILNNSEENE